MITTAIVSAFYFKGNQSHSIGYMKSHGMIDMLGKSDFTRRLHKVAPLIMWMFLDIGWMFKYFCAELEYIIDSFPVKVCHIVRISRCKLLKGKQWRGYNASKWEYFFGVKVHLIVIKWGVPGSYVLFLCGEHDMPCSEK